MNAGGRATQEQLPSILTLPPDTADFPLRWRLMKLLFSKDLPRTERLSATRKRVSNGEYGSVLG
jgi:putative transposase